MYNLFKKIILIIFIFIFYYNIGNANISFTVSPIKYEIEASTGSTITRKALLFNRTDSTIIINTGVSDFEAKDDSGTPRFIKKSSNEYTGQELSNWININQESFNIGPKEKKEIEFSIEIPTNATPGGHYGAVFFKNKNTGTGSSGQIKINVDYGVLLLVNVEGEIIIDGETEDTNIIVNSSGGGGWALKKDDCPYGDLTTSYYDNKCIDDLEDIVGKIIDKDLNEEENEEKNNDEDFNIIFEIPFDNNGNTHIKPTGKIKLIDEDGNEIKGIGEEAILNKDGAIIGKKIVDYLPINDIGGNVLPNTNRKFESEWKGFPYKKYDGTIGHWTPEEYYTRKNLEENKYLMPWERFNTRICDKIIKVITEMSYIDENGEEVKFHSAKDLNIKYKETYIGLNPYFIFCTLMLFFIFFLLWLIFKKKKKKCRKCGKRIDKDMKICPYCGKKQKK